MLSHRRTGTRVVWGLVAIVVYAIAAYPAAGAGHGTYIFMAPLMPYGLGGAIYPVLFGLSANLRSTFVKVLYLVVALIHYALTCFFLISWWEGDAEYLYKTWDQSPLLVLIPIAFFTAIQVAVWALFIKNLSPTSVDLK